MWGKDSSESVETMAYRITPAHAGKRKKVFDWIKDTKDHPRTCGEKRAKALSQTAKKGSPPAHAGKSLRRLHSFPYYLDHPRTCEEKF